MDGTLFVLVLVLMLALCFAVGLKVGQGQSSSVQYFLSSRNIGTMPLALSLLATQVGGGAIVGTASTTYTEGVLAAMTYPLGIATGLILLSLGLGGRLRALEVNTIPELFLRKYHSPSLQRLTGLVSLITLFLILVATAIALRSFCGFLGVVDPIWIAFIWMAFVIYTSIGGLQAVVQTDRIQIGYILLVFVALGLAWIFQGEGSLTGQGSSLVASHMGIFSWRSFLYAMCFTVIGQDMGQRCLAASDERKILLSTRIAAVLMLLMALVPIGLSLAFRMHGHSIGAGDCLILRAVSIFFGDRFASIFAVAVILAIVSTADSLICSISSHIRFDLNLWPRLEDEKRLGRAKVFTALLGMVALVISYWQNSIIDLMVSAYELFVGLFFIPIVMTLLTKNPQRSAAVVTVAFGLCWLVVGRRVSFNFDPTFLSLVLSGLVYFGAHKVSIVAAGRRGKHS